MKGVLWLYFREHILQNSFERLNDFVSSKRFPSGVPKRIYAKRVFEKRIEAREPYSPDRQTYINSRATLAVDL